MANLFEAGADLLNAALGRHASVTVTYRRGNLSATFAATPGSQLLRTTDGKGNTKVERTDRDFLFEAALLVLGGRVVEPDRGDLIDATFADGATRRFRVMAPGNEPHFRYSDTARKRLRVHTKADGAG